ncbi:hypothetical protein ABO04_04950 [Nitrosomonas sp. HPC101]|uniref:hypothetical protein n=1 Tax=Nitrosomonas sp. HPC101 TaxID=1658667 RepID=UPI00136BCDD2|nr:hypothetical protein [Nitrosomonas sp. HPC101]MXS85282.1 hypothetical protein [Nitrosomonas sp. HPC101]
MTVAQASQVVVEVLRTNTKVEAQASQLVVELLRGISLAANAQVDQVVVEVLRAERTLAASFNCGLVMQPDLVPGSALGATFTTSLSVSPRLELGTEFSPAVFPVSMASSAALRAESVLKASLDIAVTGVAQLQEGIEFDATCQLPVVLRAGLKVYPEPVTGFFLLF